LLFQQKPKKREEILGDDEGEVKEGTPEMADKTMTFPSAPGSGDSSGDLSRSINFGKSGMTLEVGLVMITAR
jgi:hypothetical protein